MSKFGINFIGAQDAGLTLTIETAEGRIQRRAKDSQDVADWIKEFGMIIITNILELIHPQNLGCKE